MYRIKLNHIEDKYDFNELIKIFLTPDSYEAIAEGQETSVSEHNYQLIEINKEGLADKNKIKQEIYKELAKVSGKNPPWGILTGVRPVKLTGELFKLHGSKDKVKAVLKEEFLLREDKADLLIDIYLYQRSILNEAKEKSVGLYIGIPFCPTRCLYCSFTSNQKGEEEIEKYLEALYKEIEYCGAALKRSGMTAESVYIGGGTPTTLDKSQLFGLLGKIKECFDLSHVKEFTVEAGRPDTITEEKLSAIMSHGIKRISINPQTMKDDTLKLIGRAHSAEEIKNAFRTASAIGDFVVNADLIAGLPGETAEDFKNSLKEVINLSPENITVHTLAVKKASRLIEADESYHYKQAGAVEAMLKAAADILKESGYRPYYLYRQKHMAGALENTGYCKGDTPCVYNIRIMDESQSILALGAGGISKKYYPEENRLERVPNVSNYQIYIERINDMIERKRINFFEEV